MDDQFIENHLARFQSELHACDALDVSDLPDPTLANVILPMFRLQRWATGYNQHTRRLYRNLVPGLRLASLMLKEPCMLPWWIHLSCGHRTPFDHPESGLSGNVYIASGSFEKTSNAQSNAIHELHNLGTVITFMFIPRKYYRGNVCGITSSRRDGFEWMRKFRSNDLTPIPDRFRGSGNIHGHPTCALAPEFQDFFLTDFASARIAQRYKMWFFFAETLVHEVAHAYWIYLGRRVKDGKEPCWCKHEKTPELGFSWETNTLGRIINPMRNDMNNCGALISYQAEEYIDNASRKRAVKRVLGRLPGVNELTRVANSQGEDRWLSPFGLRGYDWFLNADGRRYGSVSVVHAIPMQWIVNWFLEEEWSKKRRTWRKYRTYSPPSLGSTFLLLHEQSVAGVACLRILTNSRVDLDLYVDTDQADTVSGNVPVR